MKVVLAVSLLLAMVAPAGGEDLGIINERDPEEGVVFGGQPSADQVVELAAAGFKTVIDLRGESEDRGFDEDTAMAAAGLDYVKIPVTSGSLALPETFEHFFKEFEAAEKPVLVHCASGNRVGALYYAWLVSEKGVPRDDALATAQENGLRSEALADLANGYLDSH